MVTQRTVPAAGVAFVRVEEPRSGVSRPGPRRGSRDAAASDRSSTRTVGGVGREGSRDAAASDRSSTRRRGS
ncbi:MAG TPA: hypothetical protein VFS72_06775, partial [Agromyces sp.]|nr:hypothetical protein [Agromyces sp.]